MAATDDKKIGFEFFECMKDISDTISITIGVKAKINFLKGDLITFITLSEMVSNLILPNHARLNIIRISSIKGKSGVITVSAKMPSALIPYVIRGTLVEITSDNLKAEAGGNVLEFPLKPYFNDMTDYKPDNWKTDGNWLADADG